MRTSSIESYRKKHFATPTKKSTTKKKTVTKRKTTKRTTNPFGVSKLKIPKFKF